MVVYDMFPDEVFSDEMVEAIFLNNFGDVILKVCIGVPCARESFAYSTVILASNTDLLQKLHS
jgi:hypothetical protein